MSAKTFNLYCDESCHIKGDMKPYMFLGSIRAPFNMLRRHTRNINSIKKKHNFYAEIKWSYVSKSKALFYEELVDYFFESDLMFRVVGIEKSKIDYEKSGKTHDEFYYTMYYYLLNHNLNSTYEYNVYLDIKDTLSANKVGKLKHILNSQMGLFKNVQNIRSNESIIMQLTDFLMGAVSYLHNNKEKSNETKNSLIQRIKDKSEDSLCQTNYSTKLNLFFIELSKYAS